ncbi:MAG: hypothetical protein SVZ03_14550 [Spirochaetota bacterium]|nr:hypothetical protein [Spirochaetota bacterium]
MQKENLNNSYTIYINDICHTVLGDDIFDWRQRFFKEFADYLCKKGQKVKIIEKETLEVRLDGSVTRDVIIRDSTAVIQNNITKHFYVLDCHDWIRPDNIELMVHDPRCKKVLKCQYHKKSLNEPIYDKIKPWTYFDRFWPTNEELLIASRKIKRTTDSLYFRGFSWGPRVIIVEELIKRGILNPDYERIEFEEYLKECSQHRIMLSLPGMADICHRDIEGFANGTCVLRPKVQIEFHNRLIPDHHYINIDIDINKATPIEFADKIEQRYNEVKDDHEYLDWVARNAMQWYDENVSLQNILGLTKQLLDL